MLNAIKKLKELLKMIKEAKEKPFESTTVIQRLDKCKWEKLDGYDREQYYDTECGNSRYFPENDEDILYFKYCPYCGKAIEPIE